MEIRNLREEEIPQYWELIRYVFRNWQEEPYNDEDHSWFVPQESYGLFDEGRLKSAVVARRFRQVIRGVVKPMGGIAGVGSYPEVRGQGGIRDLFRYMYASIRDQGRPISLLHPFRESFYERLGYTAAPSTLRVGFATAAFVHHRGAGRDFVEDRRGSEGHDEFLDWVAAQAPRLYHGFVLRDPDNPAFWIKHYRDPRMQFLFLRRDGKIRAAACYRGGSRLDPPRLEFNTAIWLDKEARNAFFAFCAKHQDQTARIDLPVPPGTSAHSWARDTMQRWHLDLDEKPWMVRVVDVVGAVEGLPTAEEDQALAVGVNDPLCPWNTGTFLIEGRRGRLSAQPSDREPSFKLDIRGLSALVYGTLDAEELRLRGWLTEAGAGDTSVLDRLFPAVPFFNTTYF